MCNNSFHESSIIDINSKTETCDEGNGEPTQEPGIFSLYSIINQHYFILRLISEIHDIIKTSKMQGWGAYHIPT